MVRGATSAREAQVTLTNAEREMLWIDGWNDLSDARAKLGDGYLVDAEWNEVTVEDCKGLIQATAYATGKRVQLERVFYRGKPSLQFHFV